VITCYNDWKEPPIYDRDDEEIKFDLQDLAKAQTFLHEMIDSYNMIRQDQKDIVIIKRNIIARQQDLRN
jgi:hypothetical protein